MPDQPDAPAPAAVAATAAGVVADRATQAARALRGDRAALVGLLQSAVSAGMHLRARPSVGTPARMQALADRIAACYSADRPPSDRDCDEAFALAVEVDLLAGAAAGRPHPAATREPPNATRATDLVLEARHAARAHAAALAEAAAIRRPVESADALAADRLYELVRDLARLAHAAAGAREP